MVDSATIFGRITPQQKARIIQCLRERGRYVGMIGDGVNDVLSLKRANLAIAMRSGSQATRGVADIVFMDDSFAVLAPAVAEGQRILNGMQAILKLFLTRISTVGLVILSSLVVGLFPLELRQGSLVTLFSVGIPTILLAIWARPGPTPQGTLTRRLLHFIVPPALLTSAFGLILFSVVYGQRQVDSLAVAQTDADGVSRLVWPLPGDLRGATYPVVGDRKWVRWRLEAYMAGGWHDGGLRPDLVGATVAHALCPAAVRAERICRIGDCSWRLAVGAADYLEIPAHEPPFGCETLNNS